MHDFVSILVLHSSSRGRESWFLAIVVLQVYCYYKCSVILPFGAVGSLKCVFVVFPDHTHILFRNSIFLSISRSGVRDPPPPSGSTHDM